jgi:hypothetical protein
MILPILKGGSPPEGVLLERCRYKPHWTARDRVLQLPIFDAHPAPLIMLACRRGNFFVFGWEVEVLWIRFACANAKTQ